MSERFPDSFLWGAATSAYQIEGSRDADGAGPSIWDEFCARPGVIESGDDARTACDSYRNPGRDIALLREIGVGAYRFSTGWSRVVPDGTGTVNARALDHYERFVDALLEAGITPVLTLNHWDMPLALASLEGPLGGGWLARSCVDAFVHYAGAVVKRLGDRVPYWITQNEPWVVQLLGYRLGLHAPGTADPAREVAVGHHMLLGHGAAADVIHAAAPTAQVSVALSLYPCEPASADPADVAAARASDGYVNRWFLDPLHGRGYPEDMRENWSRALAQNGAPFGLSDVIAPGDEALIANRTDFLAVNYYTRRVCAAPAVDSTLSFPWRVVEPTGERPRTDLGWEICPDSFERLLVRLDRDYGSPPIMITENGAAFKDAVAVDASVPDARRTAFLRQHLAAVLRARAAGVDVRGYLYWSLLDNFEWAMGYRPAFGLVHLDRATGRCLPKDSARFYCEVIRAGRLPGSGISVLPAT